MDDSTITKVLSLNAYYMGHTTYQNTLEEVFSNYISGIDFHSLHFPEQIKQDYFGRIIRWLVTKRLPGANQIDYDFYRLRHEFAQAFLARRCLNRAMEEIQPDVLHLNTQIMALASVDLIRRIPTIISGDCTTAILIQKYGLPTSLTCKPVIALERRCFHAATHVITWSDMMRQSIINDYGVCPEKVTTLHPGVILDRFKKPLHQCNTDASKLRILFVGNDFKRKGGQDLLAVFLENFLELCELDIVSNTNLDLPNLPNIRHYRGIKGNSKELIELYQKADIFVLPTYDEVYGLVFGEAIAAGLPCIGTEIMAIPEFIQNGYNGITIKPGDRKALSEALQTLINNPELRISMKQASQKVAQEKFDAVANCNKMAQLFRSLHFKEQPNLIQALTT